MLSNYVVGGTRRNMFPHSAQFIYESVYIKRFIKIIGVGYLFVLFTFICVKTLRMPEDNYILPE